MRGSSRVHLLAGLSALAIAAPAQAQQNQQAVQNAPQVQAQGDLPDQSTIVITGTRRVDRTVANSPVPVDVLSAESLSHSGFTEINRALTQEVPSFNFPQPSITDGTDVIRPATLRGLGPDQTLVLINGTRRHTSALLNITGSVGRGTSAVDVNMIPTIALSRVEVLRDGAAAQYGSDAIAGVINFQLRSARNGGRASVTYGQYYTHVQGVQTYDGVLVGPGNTPIFAAEGSPILALDYTGNDRKRTDGATLTTAAVIGLPIGSRGFVDIAGEYQHRDPTNRTGADPRRQYPLIAGALDPRELTFNRFSHRYGDAKTVDGKFWVNAMLPVGAAELYAFGNVNHRDGDSAGFYRLANDSRNIPAIYPNGFLPRITTDTDDAAGTIGVRGDLSGWRWDVSGQHGEDRVDFTIRDSLNTSLGAVSSAREFYSGALKYGQTLFNLDVSRDLDFSALDKTTLSLGGEYRRETFEIVPGEENSYVAGPFPGPSGAQVFPGFQPIIGGVRVDQEHARHNWSAYAEVDADLTRNINLQGALRYEDYSDFGSKLNWKIAGRVEPVRGFAVRASASTGFRAPSLQQQFYAARATNNVAGVLLETVTLPVSNPVAVALGATPLKPETSRNYSVGVVMSAVPRLNVTLDAYQVDIDDRIVVTENLAATRHADRTPCSAPPPTGCNAIGGAIATILNGAGFQFVDAARFFVNGVDTRTQGLDFVATYRVPQVFGGRLNLTGGFNYNKTKIRRILAAPGPLANIPGLVLFGRQESLRLVKGQPRTKINLSADYDRRWLGATLRTTRYGKVVDAGAPATGVQDIFMAPKWITDAELRFKPMGDRFTIALGGNNIFDVYPTNIPRGLSTDPVTVLPATRYVAPFSNFSPFGFNGRFLYGRVDVNF